MKGLVLRADWDPRKDYKITEWEVKTKKSITASSVWRNPKLKLEEIKKPKIGSKDVLLKIKSCGICGTDTHLVEYDKDGYVLYPGLIHFPVILGHEFSGIIEEKGKDVIDFEVGDMVDIMTDSSQHKRGMPHRRYHGRTGSIVGTRYLQ